MTDMTKGATGEILAGLRNSGEPVRCVRRGRSALFIQTLSGAQVFSVSLRGNSKDRRKLARRATRWLNGGEY